MWTRGRCPPPLACAYFDGRGDLSRFSTIEGGGSDYKSPISITPPDSFIFYHTEAVLAFLRGEVKYLKKNARFSNL